MVYAESAAMDSVRGHGSSAAVRNDAHMPQGTGKTVTGSGIPCRRFYLRGPYVGRRGMGNDRGGRSNVK